MREVYPSIVVDAIVRFGMPVIKGTRVLVDLLVSKVAGGMSIEDVAQEYDVTPADVRAVIGYAAHILSEVAVYAAD